jgi:hypothetical protein
VLAAPNNRLDKSSQRTVTKRVQDSNKNSRCSATGTHN